VTPESSAFAPSPAYEVTPADELFVNLDGTLLQHDGHRWSVEICGIHASGDRYWIQVNLCADECCGVTVSADRLEASNVRSILLDWLRHSAPAHDGVGVISTAHA